MAMREVTATHTNTVGFTALVEMTVASICRLKCGMSLGAFDQSRSKQHMEVITFAFEFL